ncbi:hypothetical protein [Desulfomicrobium baculatum]|uniref:Uncharacterized protein n=1 Tax=Desulfomicrobium baculatum (strain DSM 4028 / VKM B-1378 / X) TaxID=525897 RepID=C7LPG1_DESBD|nr:hypothetical protein [Desulfomicrobium baculatum]ACU89004.1 hypothetical protein Dbac_0887 [Desulfomicrobium baculatum DSM 4028]
MNEIFEAIKNRISNPVFGYYVIAFSVANWDSLFYAIVSNNDVIDRIDYFKAHADLSTLVYYPLVCSIIIALSHHWIILFVEYLNQYPMLKLLYIKEKLIHNTAVLHNNLELQRNKLLAEAENTLIERARNYENIEDIKNEDIKSALKKEIDDLREQYKYLSKNKAENQSQSKYREMMDAANDYRSKAGMANIAREDRDKYERMAMNLEEEAYNLLLPDSRSNNVSKRIRRIA